MLLTVSTACSRALVMVKDTERRHLAKFTTGGSIFPRDISQTTCIVRFFPYLRPCPNRTCLWSCVGRRQSRTRGRRTVVEKTGSRRRTGEPRLCGGSRLKATTDRAFLVSVGPPKADLPERLVFLAGRADGNSPFQTMATRSSVALALPRRTCPTAQHPTELAQNAGAVMVGGSTRLHPRLHRAG
jgi:hypothetical protein